MAKKFKDLEKAFNQLQKDFAEYKKANRKAPEIGDKIEVSDITWIILDKLENGYFAVAFDSVGNRTFGSNNDWKESTIRKYLNEDIRNKIESDIGESLPEFERDLWSLDGQTEYGTCKDRVSLITVDEYRKHRKYIPNMDDWWWTCSPHSTKCNKDSSCIPVVSPSGFICVCSCSRSYGVRPVCIFPSSIFES